MTCFWEGITNGLSINILGEPCKSRNYVKFISYLKKHSNEILKAESLLTWNGETLIEKYLQEQRQHIQNYDISLINNGHDCSTCDPFLILIAILFRVTIHHNYNGSMIKYERKNAKKVIIFSSNIGHFYY
jgi:hypothetical protein